LSCRSAGFSNLLIYWITAPSYGDVGADTPAAQVLEATR
jgi:hypothetical protein